MSFLGIHLTVFADVLLLVREIGARYWNERGLKTKIDINAVFGENFKIFHQRVHTVAKFGNFQKRCIEPIF